jgi:hypothetical protein
MGEWSICDFQQEGHGNRKFEQCWFENGLLLSQKNVEVAAVSKVSEAASEAKKYSYRNIYKGENPMTRTQWRRYQRQKKLVIQSPNVGGNIKTDQKIKLAKKPTNEKESVPVESSKTENEKDADNKDDFMDDDLLDEEDVSMYWSMWCQFCPLNMKSQMKKMTSKILTWQITSQFAIM